MPELGSELWRHPDDARPPRYDSCASATSFRRESKARCRRRGARRMSRHDRASDLESPLLRRARRPCDRQGSRAWCRGLLAGRSAEVSCSMPDEILTVTELSEYLRLSRSTIYRLAQTRKIPAFKIGSDWRFNREQIDEWRAAQEKKPK